MYVTEIRAVKVIANTMYLSISRYYRTISLKDEGEGNTRFRGEGNRPRLVFGNNNKVAHARVSCVCGGVVKWVCHVWCYFLLKVVFTRASTITIKFMRAVSITYYQHALELFSNQL